MPHETFVVKQPSNGLYLTGYNDADPPSSMFGNLNSAIEYLTQGAADTAAANIGGGTVGLPKPH